MTIDIRERDIECYLINRVRILGGKTRKVKWIGRHSAPDRRVMLPKCCFWVEVKAPGKRLRGAQFREICRMRDLGERVFVVSSLEMVDQLLPLRA
jgi:hypothetical protein